MNMLCKWCAPAGYAYLAEEVADEVDNEILTWYEDSVTKREPVLGDELDARQRGEIQELLCDYPNVMRASPGQNTLAEHRIHTGSSPPTRQPPYRLAHPHKVDGWPYSWAELLHICVS